MQLAVDEAIGGLGRVEPNPMVGCVIVRDGRVIGRGHHESFGAAHAEINALADCARRGKSPAGATAYVTLEPCCHFGKTPPCAEKLIDAKIARVVVAVVDPFDQVDGGGVRRLRGAGIEVVTGVGEPAATSQLAAYLKRVRTGRPWVIAKWAMSLDGRIATASGESQWITGESARREVHRLRGRVDAIAVGMGTVVADDPLLTNREGGPRTPARIVFARTRLPDRNRRLVQTASQTPVWVFAGPEIPESRRRELTDQHVHVLPLRSTNRIEMVDEALQHLGSDENPSGVPLTHLMLEGGGELLGSFAAAGQIDECHVYLGGKLIGGRSAPGPVGDPGIEKLSLANEFQVESLESFDNDVRIIYRKIGGPWSTNLVPFNHLAVVTGGQTSEQIR